VRDFRQLFSNPNSTPSAMKSVFDAVNVTDVFVKDVWDASSRINMSTQHEASSKNFKNRMADIEMSPLIFRWDEKEAHVPQTRPS